MLNIFGINFTALRLSGGIIVWLLGYEMLQGQQSNGSKTTEDTIENVTKEESSIAITPLGTPLLAGLEL